MSTEFFKPKSGVLKAALFGTLIGTATVLAAMLLFAALIYFLNLDRAYAAPLATLSLGLGSFTAALFVSKKTGQKGYLTGIIVGLITFAIVTAISIIVSNAGITINTLFHFIIILLASAIGGILGVNSGQGRYI